MTNRFKGLDLIDKVLEELWMEVHDIVQEAVNKTIMCVDGDKGFRRWVENEKQRVKG